MHKKPKAIKTFQRVALVTCAAAISVSANLHALEIPGGSSGGDLMKAVGFKPQAPKIEDLMDFKSCVQEKVKFMGCPPMRCGTKPAPTIKFTYQEPAAVVDVSCLYGKSILAESQGLAGAGISKILFGAMDKVVDQKCHEGKSGVKGSAKTNQPDWFFNAHVWGISPFARAIAGQKTPVKTAITFACNPPFRMDSGKSITSALKGLQNLLTVASNPGSMPQFAAGTATAYLPWGLSPAYMTELNPQWASQQFSLTSGAAAANPVAAAAACSGDAAINGIGSLLKPLGIDNPISLGLDDVGCVGPWGMEDPKSGHSTNKLRPMAAALSAYRGYKLAVAGRAAANSVGMPQGFSAVLVNTHGKQQFNMDYPFIKSANPSISGAFNAAAGVSKGNKKGSSCYDVGTISQAWFTQGEANVLDILDKVVDPATHTGEAGSVATGDYVFTFWKKTSCCVALPCWKVRKHY